MAYRVFVSAPFAGKTELDILRSISDAGIEFIKDHAEEINDEIRICHNYSISKKLEDEAKAAKHPHLIYLAEAIRNMANCDDVIFAEGWEDARGCQVERLVYEKYFRGENKG